MRVTGPLRFDDEDAANSRIARWLGQCADYLAEGSRVEDVRMRMSATPQNAQRRAFLLWRHDRLVATAFLVIDPAGLPLVTLIEYGSVGFIHVAGPKQMAETHAG